MKQKTILLCSKCKKWLANKNRLCWLCYILEKGTKNKKKLREIKNDKH